MPVQTYEDFEKKQAQIKEARVYLNGLDPKNLSPSQRKTISDTLAKEAKLKGKPTPENQKDLASTQQMMLDLKDMLMQNKAISKAREMGKYLSDAKLAEGLGLTGITHRREAKSPEAIVQRTENAKRITADAKKTGRKLEWHS